MIFLSWWISFEWRRFPLLLDIPTFTHNLYRELLHCSHMPCGGLQTLSGRWPEYSTSFLMKRTLSWVELQSSSCMTWLVSSVNGVVSEWCWCYQWGMWSVTWLVCCQWVMLSLQWVMWSVTWLVSISGVMSEWCCHWCVWSFDIEMMLVTWVSGVDFVISGVNVVISECYEFSYQWCEWCYMLVSVISAWCECISDVRVVLSVSVISE